MDVSSRGRASTRLIRDERRLVSIEPAFGEPALAGPEKTRIPRAAVLQASSIGEQAGFGGGPRSQARIDRLALEGQHSEHALVNPPQRLAAHEALERLHAERELAKGEGALAGKAPGS